MEDFEVRIFINHFFTQQIALSAHDGAGRPFDDFSAARNRFSLQTLRGLNSSSHGVL